MSQESEYRQFAEECIQSARTATSEDLRKQFLDMARMWMTAAQQMDDGALMPPAPAVVSVEDETR